MQKVPYYKRRGVPGTDDIALALETIKGLQQLPAAGFYIPRFNRAADDRVSKDKREHMTQQPDIILLEGWCVASTAVGAAELIQPINVLERERDQDGLWRQYVNLQLVTTYPNLFKQL
jgi:D-glycerate 3-kinase